VSAAAALLWALVLRGRLESALAFFLTAFIASLVAVQAIDWACGYLVPLDIAGTPPPDPRNARLRLLITVSLQAAAALLIAYLVARRFRVRGRSPNSESDEVEPR